MSKLSDLTSAAARILGNMNLSQKAVLAINAASAATVKTTGALVFLVDGIQYTKAALSAQVLSALAAADFVASTSQAALNYLQPSGLTGFYVQPASTTVYYVLCVNNAGTVKVVQGTYDGQQLLAGLSAPGKSWVPDIPETWTPIGLIKIVTNSSTTFTPATTALDAAGLTVTFTDLAMLPSANAP